MAFISSVSANQNTKKKEIDESLRSKDREKIWKILETDLHFVEEEWASGHWRRKTERKMNVIKTLPLYLIVIIFKKWKTSLVEARSDEWRWREVSSNKVKVTILTLLLQLGSLGYGLDGQIRHFAYFNFV